MAMDDEKPQPFTISVRLTVKTKRYDDARAIAHQVAEELDGKRISNVPLQLDDLRVTRKGALRP